MNKPWIDTQAQRFGNHTLGIGILLIILGLIGIFVPALLSIATAALIAWLLILGSVFWSWHAYQHGAGAVDWIKAALLLITGILILVKPLTGVASLALLLGFYLFMDAFASFSLVNSTATTGSRNWLIFNGIIDIALAILLIFGWPNSSLWMVGMFIGISLFFDGWALAVIGWSIRHSKP